MTRDARPSPCPFSETTMLAEQVRNLSPEEKRDYGRFYVEACLVAVWHLANRRQADMDPAAFRDHFRTAAARLAPGITFTPPQSIFRQAVDLFENFIAPHGGVRPQALEKLKTEAQALREALEDALPPAGRMPDEEALSRAIGPLHDLAYCHYPDLVATFIGANTNGTGVVTLPALKRALLQALIVQEQVDGEDREPDGPAP